MRRLALLLLVSSLAATGCATGGGHSYGTARLSDAAAQARPDTAKVRRDDAQAHPKPLDVGRTHAESEDQSDRSSYAESEAPPEPGRSSGERTTEMIGLVGGGGSVGGASYDGFYTLGIDLGAFVSPRVRADIVGSLGGINFAGKSVQGASFNNEVEAAVDISARYYLSPPHTFTSVYPLVGVRFGTLFWSFRQPITVVEDGESRTLESDAVGFGAAYAGVGMSLMRVRHMIVGVNFTSGVKVYGWSTRAGLSNDLFPTTGYLQATVETLYRF